MKYVIESIFINSDPKLERVFYIDEKLPVKTLTNIVYLMYQIANSHPHDYSLFSKTSQPDLTDIEAVMKYTCSPSIKRVTSRQIINAIDSNSEQKYLIEDDMLVSDMFQEVGSGAILQYDFGESLYISLKRVTPPEYFDEEQEDSEEFGLLESLRDGQVESH